MQSFIVFIAGGHIFVSATSSSQAELIAKSEGLIVIGAKQYNS